MTVLRASLRGRVVMASFISSARSCTISVVLKTHKDFRPSFATISWSNTMGRKTCGRTWEDISPEDNMVVLENACMGVRIGLLDVVDGFVPSDIAGPATSWH